MTEQSDLSPEDVLQVAQRALAKANRVDDLEQQLADVQEELTAVGLRLSEFDDDREYDGLTRDDKIGLVREQAYRMAVDTTGFAKLDYNDIMWTVFDGEPGTKHCYDLMRWAAENARGFEYKTPASGNTHLAVDASEARRSMAFCSENKTTSEGGV